MMPVFQPISHLATFIFVLIFVSGFLGLMIYYWWIFRKLAFFKPKQEVIPDRPVSVVISARDEYENLKRNLPFILHQDYSDFEVVVVNDASEDETGYLLESLSREYDHLKIVTITENLNFFQGRKFPLSIGIKSASNEFLILTEAGCRPAGNQWVRQMQSAFRNTSEIVLGYSPMMRKEGFINLFSRFDNFIQGLMYLSFALGGMPYMGSGKNLSYRKSLFYRNRGFISHYKISSGEDALFINRTADSKNTRINIHPDSHAYSKAPETFSRWLRIKKTQVLTSYFFKSKHKIIQGFYVYSQLAFYTGLVALLVMMFNPVYVGALFIIKMLSQLVIFKNAMHKLNERDLLVISPLLEVMLLVVNTSLALSLLVIRKNKWK